MSPTPSITSSTSTLAKPIPDPSSRTPTPHTRNPKLKPTLFSPTHPFYRAYLALRTLSVVLALANLSLLIPAATAYSRKRWMDPTLSPTLTTLIHSGVDLFVIWKWGCRAHYYTRAVYDGLIGVGCAVGAGFLGRAVVGAVREGGEGVVGEGILGGLILGGLVAQVFIHAGVSVDGWRDMVKRKEEKKREREAAVMEGV